VKGGGRGGLVWHRTGMAEDTRASSVRKLFFAYPSASVSALVSNLALMFSLGWLGGLFHIGIVSQTTLLEIIVGGAHSTPCGDILLGIGRGPGPLLRSIRSYLRTRDRMGLHARPAN